MTCLIENICFILLYNGVSSIRKEDIDHIHPRSLLANAGFEELVVNSIINYQLLDYGTNRGEKRDKELLVWIEKSIDSANKEEYLKRHLIPNDSQLWETVSYVDFIAARGKLIVEKLREVL